MKNVLILVDKHKSAIDRLAQTIKEHNTHLNIKVLPLHPKRPDPIQVSDVIDAWEEADVVHVSYWKTGEKFKELFPELWDKKRKILWHHNPYDINKKDWKDYKRVIVHNKTMQNEIPYARYIPQCIDLDFYGFKKEYTEEKIVNMVAGRIESKKGIREVAQACKELDYKFMLVGRISNKAYFDEIMKVNPDTDFRENITDKELVDSYYESALHVCNSIDNFESGTMPILEAMACGVPVLTRNVGHVPDLYDGKNIAVRMGETSDVEDLKKELKELMESRDLRLIMRERAWKTVKNRPAEKMARMFNKVYYEISSDKPLVSVIVPTFDRPAILTECLAHIANQDYENFEVIVIDSGNESVQRVAEAFREYMPVKYIRFENNGEYTLPKARNMGVVEAQGEFLLFCDERIGMEKNAITSFVDIDIRESLWLYGIKDSVSKAFVENFSFIKRADLIKHGMFNERIDCYGGASQELRQRYGGHGYLFQLVYEAQAHALGKSSSKFNRKREITKAKLNLWKLYGTN